MSLTVTDLAKRYGSNWILRQVSFSVESGSITGIFGPKGAGKTTLLRIVAGLETPNSGSISVDSRSPAGSNIGDGIAFVPTVPASTFLQRAFSGTEASTVDTAARQADAIDRALAGTDRVIVLDDAFCFFDEATKREYFDKLRNAAASKGISVLFSTNNFGDVLAFCDQAVVIANGYAVQAGTPESIYDSPETSLVAGITGRNNLIAARRLSSSKADLPEFQTLAGEHRIFAKKIDRGGLGAINQNVTLSIRPEQISISFGASFPEDNLLKATISGFRFLGPLTLVDLDVNGLSIQAFVTRLVGLNVGDECMVGLPPDRIRILKD